MTTKKRLCNIKGLSEAKVDKIKVTCKHVRCLLSVASLHDVTIQPTCSI